MGDADVHNSVAKNGHAASNDRSTFSSDPTGQRQMFRFALKGRREIRDLECLSMCKLARFSVCIDAAVIVDAISQVGVSAALRKRPCRGRSRGEFRGERKKCRRRGPDRLKNRFQCLILQPRKKFLLCLSRVSSRTTTQRLVRRKRCATFRFCRGRRLPFRGPSVGIVGMDLQGKHVRRENKFHEERKLVVRR